MFAYDTVYSDNNVDQIEASRQRRSTETWIWKLSMRQGRLVPWVDFRLNVFAYALVTSGYAMTYIIWPSTIYGLLQANS